MEKRRPPIAAIIIVGLVILAVGGYWLYSALNQQSKLGLTSSGSVEAVEVSIAPEISGKVTAVYVSEGAVVKSGDLLFRLDDTLLNAQRNAAQAALLTSQGAVETADAAASSAQAQLDITLAAALNEDRTTRLDAWNQSKPTDFTQPSWYFDRQEQLTAAQTAAQAAQTALDDAKGNLDSMEQKSGSALFISAEKRLITARAAYQAAKAVQDRADQAKDAQDLKDQAKYDFDDAKIELTNAQKDYDDALTKDGAADVLQARAQYSIALERYDTASDNVRALQTGELSPKVTAAQKAFDQAKAAAGQTKLAVDQAQANLALIDAQITKLTVNAPSDGVILTRSIEPGGVVNPGSIVLTLARLTDLTITVYIPEDRYGGLKLGQNADVVVDSFPGEKFTGKIVFISDKAEYTPRNVQTAEGRKTTVFAVKLQVDDPSGKLKYGMPADVTFR
jgi:HlyD family secretion protein